MVNLNDWQDLFLKRKILRQQYFDTDNYNTIKKNLLQEMLSNIRDCPYNDMKILIEYVYHPDGPTNANSYGNNPYFRALLAISDQLFIYDEFIQELGLSIKQNIELVLPPSKRMKTFKHNSIDIDIMHKELIGKQQELENSGVFLNVMRNMKRMEMLEISPNKALLYKLIDGTKTQTELWQLFNQTNNLETKGNQEVSKQYIFQILREMDEDEIIKIKKRGKSKIAFKL